MLDPRPASTAAAFPRPSRVLSTSNLQRAWRQSRDSTAHPAAAGIDGETAAHFAANLHFNLAEISKRLQNGTYGFSRLRPIFIPKPNSTKDRVICIPTVRDRIVQRAIIQYLVDSRKLPIYNSSSYGFTRGKGAKEAVLKAVELRSIYEWCVKADIEAFFDRVPRPYLKHRIAAALQNHSLVPLICNAVDCEIKQSAELQPKLAKQGIRNGLGIRQGMPLSPILSNLALSKFDRSMELRRIPMIRYADDLLLFFDSKDEAKRGERLTEQLLARSELTLAVSKTQICGPHDPVDFLGREIVFLDRESQYVSRISRLQIRKIRDRLEEEYSYSNRLKRRSTLHATSVDLSRSISAYLGIYHDAYNYAVLDAEMRGAMRSILSDLYGDVFGKDALERLDEAGRDFLGIGQLQMPAALGDFDW
jgi:RNA-directed DNA polymerase